MGFIKKHSKCLVITILITLVILGGVNIYNNGWKDFIKMNAYEIVTIAIALLVTYYLTERKNDIRKLNNKIENICNNMQVYLREEYGITPSKKNKEKVLMNIRYISNKIHILEKLSEKNIFYSECMIRSFTFRIGNNFIFRPRCNIINLYCRRQKLPFLPKENNA